MPLSSLRSPLSTIPLAGELNSAIIRSGRTITGDTESKFGVKLVESHASPFLITMIAGKSVDMVWVVGVGTNCRVLKVKR
jgi:hypothetical protein